jgi:hypothetical protein
LRAEGHEERPLRDQFTKNFGVWREADGGRNVTFDVIFPRGAKLPARGEEPLRMVRRYRPMHNIGHFRYLECAQLDENQQPEGEISNWDEIRVAFDPNLRGAEDIAEQAVERNGVSGQEMWIEEEYTCGPSGDVKVKIRDGATAVMNEYRLGKWSKHRKKLKAGK